LEKIASDFFDTTPHVRGGESLIGQNCLRQFFRVVFAACRIA